MKKNIGRFLMKIKQNSLIQSNNLPSLNKKVNPYKTCIYGLCRDFLDGVGYDLGTFIFRIILRNLFGF